jgi:Cys-tRNA(Pro)/Cys-tRNA(Cys) deacylase
MKKRYPTFIDETAVLWDQIFVSAGQRGQQLVIGPDALIAFTQAPTLDLTKGT